MRRDYNFTGSHAWTQFCYWLGVLFGYLVWGLK